MKLTARNHGDFHDDDLEAALRLWDNPATAAAAAAVDRDRAWVMRISLVAAWRQRGIGSAMLTELERRLVARGVHRINCVLTSEDDIGPAALEHSGYSVQRGTLLFEKLEPLGPGDVGVLDQLGRPTAAEDHVGPARRDGPRE